ncbi:MAG: helix-turn-helix transcriptional regulator [Lentisphaerae bacterium]|nr:helix-turn-helix transcriptional regulator [Lentisphaerota bacterium]
MDKMREMLEVALDWVNRLPEVPVAYAAEDRVPVHTRASPLLEFTLHASGSESLIEVAGLRRRSRPGDFALMDAHFGNRGTPRGQWGFWCLSLDAATWPGPTLSRSPVLEAVSLRHPARVLAQFDEVGRVYKRHTETRSCRLKAEVLRLLCDLYEDCGFASRPAVASPSCQAALDAMDERQADPALDLACLARAASLSVAQLCRRFQREVGASPMRHLNRLRIERACDLLRKTTLNVGEVAHAVGFSDPLHFSRVFRRQVGLPPSAWRRASDRPR